MPLVKAGKVEYILSLSQETCQQNETEMDYGNVHDCLRMQGSWAFIFFV